MNARVLFVEDDALVRHGLARALAAAGHEVRACAGMADALEAASSFEADVALLDIGLPDGNGIECARALREAGFDGALIFLTASSESKDVADAIAQGAHTYLVKPVSGAQLLPAVQAALASTRSAADRQRALLAALRDSRDISAALGAVAQREGCTVEAAFEQLRRQARSSGRKLTEVAADILAHMHDAKPLGKRAQPR